MGTKTKALVIVESPAKARTINKFLGREFTVKASIGHVKDLPVKELGVDITRDFLPKYVTIRGKGKILSEIKKSARMAENIYLGPDPDREGEAIAWHIAEELNGSNENICRVLFNEITKKAVLDAIANPGKIDHNKVDAQQARRIMDRLVGYKISPLLWKKVKRGLSAGRVQSVAVRLIVDRERQIESFIPEEYWSITAHLQGKTPPDFPARLIRHKGKKIEIKRAEESEQILRDLKGKPFIVDSVETKEKKRYPVPPFTTSTLQQESARKLRFTAKKTMLITQQLYEGLEVGYEGSVGLITYMRTDSVRISDEARSEARGYIVERFGKDYLPVKFPIYTSRGGAQEAHEAIRPTSVLREPDSIRRYLTKDQYEVYRLIWMRFIASQMNPALIDQTSVDIKVGNYIFRATGTTVKFHGFMTIYTEGMDEDRGRGIEDEGEMLPSLSVGEPLNVLRIEPRQHFTQPPPRYTEASLVKTLEEKGIGRPSTYATILSTIQEREYVKKIENRFHPTELGAIVNDLLVANFPDILDVAFTAKMEEELDKIEEGNLRWVEVLKDFYSPFSKSLESASRNMKSIKSQETPTDIVCDKCGRKMVIKWGRHGQFLACSGYPECKNTKRFTKGEYGTLSIIEEVKTEELCEKCGNPMVMKKGRFGEFFACSQYPLCKYTKPINIGVRCPEAGCKGFLIERSTKRRKKFYSCSNYPECKFAMWDKPVPEECPQCGMHFLVEKQKSDGSLQIKCIRCGYKRDYPENSITLPLE